ncbi:MAG: ATP-binding protein [Marinilabiliaceae bacterium]|nr:ATP-binding protein [Marinilabiliaceae bacterium]
MENKRLKLPAGLPTFEEIRTNGYIYVDKTKYLVNMIDTGKIYFLARPRRFGKSLTISTFYALFSGRKDLFKGLYAEEFLNRPEFVPSPVIWLDMGGVETYYGIEGIKESIKSKTLMIADELKIDIEKNALIGDILSKLIVKTAEKYNSKVVFLLDEYDKPYTDFVNDPDMANEVRKLLRGYYSQLKANDKYLSFIFITGISKYTKMGVFSTLNNLVDISLNEEYGNICGLSEEEIINYFPDYIDETAKKMKLSTDDLLKKMKKYYNGFCFDKGGQHRLYNPFSTLNFFFSKYFSNYWIESGTSAMFVEFLKSNRLSVEQFRNFPATDNFLYHSTEIEKAEPESFLFQTGYLSLRKNAEDKLVLDYPNTEVLNALSALVSEYIMENQPDDFTYCRNDFLIALERRMVELVISVFNRLLASIPFDDFNKAAQQAVLFNNYNFSVQEWLYRSNILSFLRGCGVVVIAEMHTNLGCPDIVVNYMKKTWVMELKVAYKGESVTDKVEEACKQITDNNYAKPYPDAICLAMVIDDEVRQITEYKVF